MYQYKRKFITVSLHPENSSFGESAFYVSDGYYPIRPSQNICQPYHRPSKNCASRFERESYHLVDSDITRAAADSIFTWPTIFHLELSQQRGNFSCLNLTTNSLLNMNYTKGPRRPGFSRTREGRDDRHFRTLEPDIPTTFTGRFGLAYPPTPTVEAGHRYRLSLNEGQKISWWRYGRKDEVLALPGVPSSLGDTSGGSIYLEMDPVEFDVE